MEQTRFKEIVNEMFTQCCDLLNIKEQEYSDGKDRLVQFKLAGELSQTTMLLALRGMMIKHTTKLYFMLREIEMTGQDFTRSQWEEVLNDHANYLFLLKAVLYEGGYIEDNVEGNPSNNRTHPEIPAIKPRGYQTRAD